METNSTPAHHPPVGPKIQSHPFFSVVIATYNRADLIVRAVKSLVSQTEKDWEAIIVDDGSTDDTYWHMIPYLKKYPNIRYLKQAHQGAASSKNTGIRSATGSYVTFLDSDDEFNPYHLASRKEFLKQNPSAEWLHGKVKIIGNQYVPDRYKPREKIHLDQCVIGANFFIERNTAIALKGFRNLKIGIDADLFDRAKNAGVKMLEVRLPTYIYHHESVDSITNKMLLNAL